MRKITIIFAVMAAILLVAACQPQPKGPATAPSDAGQETPADTDISVEEEPQADDTEPAAEDTGTSGSDTEPGISQEDLDDLQRDLEGMQIEDLDDMSE